MSNDNGRIYSGIVPDIIAQRQFDAMLGRVENALTRNYQTIRSRGAVSDSHDSRRDLNDECGYPNTDRITIDHYKNLYLRNPIAKKVVDLKPLHCWQVHPTVYETDDAEEETAFEQAIKDLGNKLRGESWYQDDEGDPVWEAVGRVDRVSGIGRYGVLLIGVGGAEGKDLSQPLEPRPGDSVSRELIYLKAFPEYLAPINSYINNPGDPKRGAPESYNLSLDGSDVDVLADVPTATPLSGGVNVHWTRVIHVPSDIISNEYLGVPRMLPVINRLFDLDKLYGGSAEMYWQGAFPGISLQTHPQLGGDVVINPAALKTQMEYMMNGLQRWMVTKGLDAKTLSPTVVDPTPQIEAQIQAICIEQDCPKRIFMGSERGELASDQDKGHWNRVVDARRKKKLTPGLIVPLTNRFIGLGILPRPQGYSVDWPEIETLSPLEIADRALKIAQALVAYIQGDGMMLMPPMQFLTVVLGLDVEEARSIVDELEKDDLIQTMIDRATAEPEPQVIGGAPIPGALGKTSKGVAKPGKMEGQRGDATKTKTPKEVT